jgi:hypothetical protein
MATDDDREQARKRKLETEAPPVALTDGLFVGSYGFR